MNIIEKTLMITGMYIGTIIILFMSTIMTLVNVDIVANQMMGNNIQLSMEPVIFVFYTMIIGFTTVCFISYRERA